MNQRESDMKESRKSELQDINIKVLFDLKSTSFFFTSKQVFKIEIEQNEQKRHVYREFSDFI